jgi:cysteine desulfurase
LPVDDEGLISFDDLEKKITKDTVLVSLIYVNNETGTVQPVEKLGQLLEKINKTRKMPIALHLDATQAVAYLNTDMQKLKVDLLSMSAHKINGPKGTGVLVYRKNVSLVRQMDGGSQEDNLRSGTENVAGIVGLARALTDLNNKKQIAQKVSVLRDKLIKGVLAIDGVRLTGSPKQRAPHIASFVFDGLEGESLVLMLSDKGVAAASGSACTAGNLNPSHVLTAMGVKKENCHGSLRLSLSSQTTEAEIDRVLKVLPLLVKKLRLMAPQL